VGRQVIKVEVMVTAHFATRPDPCCPHGCWASA
jgi:hypothetical protein